MTQQWILNLGLLTGASQLGSPRSSLHSCDVDIIVSCQVVILAYYFNMFLFLLVMAELTFEVRACKL